MTTKSRRRAARRHPELENPEALAAVGNAIVSLVTLGVLEDEEEAPPRSVPSERQPNHPV